MERYGAGAAEATPPFRRILESGVKVSAGTDATRVASYDPRGCLSWLVTGKTLGGTALYPERNLLDRETALRMWTEYTTWFSNEEGKKGRIEVGQLADLAVLDRDFMTVPEAEIRNTQSLLTVVGGKPVYAAGEFADLDPPLPPAMPDWSPVRTFGGYRKTAEGMQRNGPLAQLNTGACGCGSTCGVHGHAHARAAYAPTSDRQACWGALGCSCWAV